MATITAGDFRNGKTFEMDGKIMQVVEFQHVKPGKGAAFVRTKMKNIITTMGSPKLRLSSATGFMPPTSMSASNPAMLGQTMSIKIQPYSRPRKIPISLMPSAVNGSTGGS